MAVEEHGDDARGDVQARIAALESALAERDARLAEQDAKLAEQDAKLAEQAELIAKLVAQLQQLTEQLGRNSRNSHLPPSSDGPGGGSRPARRPKAKSKRKRGGQKGRRGAHRQLCPAASVDEFVEFFPSVCLECAGRLPHVHDPHALRYQHVDLRDGRRHRIEYRRHEVECPRCRHRTVAPYDAAQIPPSAFGPRLVAVVAMLTGAYHLSRRKAQQLVAELFEISISLGSISAIERRASRALEAAYDEAKRHVEQAAVKHADATSWTRAGRLMSLWTLASTMATVYAVVADGCCKTIEPLFGPLVGILVSDRASVFGFWAMARRQVCWAHLLRRFVAFSERDGPAGRFGRELIEFTALVFDYWHGYKDGKLSRAELEIWLRPVQRQFEATLQRAVAADIPRLSGSCADMLAHRDALWTFVTHEGVEPTNNHAERELRAFVLWRKRSFGSQSERGERFAERLMTVAQTARKRGVAVLEFITRAVTAHSRGASAPRLWVAT